MDFLAYAVGSGGAGGSGGQGGGFGAFLPLIILFVIFYFLLIRPQQRKSKQHKEMLASLKEGDRIVSSGGLHGIVTGMAEDTVTIEIAPKVRAKIARASIAELADKKAASKSYR